MRGLLVRAACLAALGGALSAAEWSTLSTQSSLPGRPPWGEQMPKPEELQKWAGPESERLLRLATELDAFVMEHPGDASVPAARAKESEALYSAARLGHAGAEKALAALDSIRLSDPKTPVEARLAIRSRQVDDAARLKYREDAEAGQAAYITGVRALTKEFPDRPEPWLRLISMADPDNLVASHALLEEVRDDSHQPEPRELAEAVLRRFDDLNHAIELKFTALGGQAIDLKALAGRVVVLNFWATFNEPSVESLLNLREYYERYHEKGLEILSINLDDEPQRVAAFVKAKALPWPQACDGKGWKTDLAAHYGVRALPLIWIIDRHGVLRDLKAGRNMRDKVESLLEEKG